MRWTSSVDESIPRVRLCARTTVTITRPMNRNCAGYVASRNIMIDVRDLDKLAPIVEGAVDAGVNQVSPPQLYSSKRRTAYREALDKAAADARANAEQLAKSLDVELGDAISISSLPMATPVPQPYMARAMAADAGAEATYNAGDQSIDATVTVIFEIDD